MIDQIDYKFWGAMITTAAAMIGWMRSSFTLGRRIGSFETRIDGIERRATAHSEEILVLKENTCVGGPDCEKFRENCRKEIVRTLDSGDDRMGRIETAIRENDQAAQRRHDSLVNLIMGKK